MQPHIDEVSRNVLSHRPLPRRLGNHQRHAVFPQHVDERRGEKALMPDFHGMSQGPLGVDFELDALGHPVIMLARDCSRFLGVVRQQLQKSLEPLRIEFEVGRELPQDRSQLLLQVEQS